MKFDINNVSQFLAEALPGLPIPPINCWHFDESLLNFSTSVYDESNDVSYYIEFDNTDYYKQISVFACDGTNTSYEKRMPIYEVEYREIKGSGYAASKKPVLYSDKIDQYTNDFSAKLLAMDAPTTIDGAKYFSNITYYKYINQYSNWVNYLSVPELKGRRIIKEPEYELDGENYQYYIQTPLGKEEFEYFEVQKEGGNSQAARASSYYAKLTSSEAEHIVKLFLTECLGIEDSFVLGTTNSLRKADPQKLDKHVGSGDSEYRKKLITGRKKYYFDTKQLREVVPKLSDQEICEKEYEIINTLFCQEESKTDQEIAIIMMELFQREYNYLPTYLWLGEHANNSWTRSSNLRAAAEYGSIEASFKLGITYLKEGRNKDGFLYCKQAAEKGHPEALLLCGDIYYKGMHPELAKDYYEKALANGAKTAKDRLKRITNHPDSSNAPKRIVGFSNWNSPRINDWLDHGFKCTRFWGFH